MSVTTEDQGNSQKRYIARKLPRPLLQIDFGLDELYQVEWEIWDTQLNKRTGPVFSELFAEESTCRAYTDKYNYSEGPPRRCGSCGKVFAEGESTFGHAFYHLLCFYCSAANEE